MNEIKERLEYLRGEIRAETIGWGEIAELQSLAEYIDPGDVELLEAADVPEFPEGETVTITINTDNDAFEDLTGEVARILRDAAEKIDGNPWVDAGYSFPLFDYNGNEVGYVSVK